MSFPLYFFLFPYFIFLAVWLVLSLVWIYHMLRYGFFSSVSVFILLVFVGGAAAILNVTYDSLIDIDWQHIVSIGINFGGSL